MTSILALKQSTEKFLKFAGVGAVMTLFGLSLNTLFLKVLQTPLYITWGSIYMANTTISYLLNSRFTFKSSVTGRKWFLYVCVYGSSLLVGLGLLRIYKHWIPLENWIYPFMVVPITMLWNFFWSRFILQPDRK